MTALGAPRFLPLPHLSEEEIVELVKHPVATGILLLLTTRSPFAGPHAGEAPGKWTQANLAQRFGCTERHVRSQLHWLKDEGYLTITRTQDGARLTLARHPFHQEEPEPQFRSQFETGTTVPVEPEPQFRFPIRESESSSKGEGPPTVVQAAALTPPAVASFSPETVQAIATGEALRSTPFTPEVRTTLGYKLDALTPAARLPALKAAIRVMTEHPGWNQDAPETWRGQIEKAASGLAVRSARPTQPPSTPPPLPAEPDPVRNQAELEAARARMAQFGMNKRNEAIRRRFGVAS